MNQNQRNARDSHQHDAQQLDAQQKKDAAAKHDAAGKEIDKQVHPGGVDPTTAAQKANARKEAESQPKGQPQESVQTRNQGGAHPNG